MPVLLESRKSSPVVRNSIPPTTAPPLEDVDTDELIRKITRQIKRKTNFGVQEMAVTFQDGKMILTGYCRTFFTKQLAQEAALKFVGECVLVNKIRVA